MIINEEVLLYTTGEARGFVGRVSILLIYDLPRNKDNNMVLFL